MKYYVNRVAQPNRDHEVHVEGCQWMPDIHNRIELGQFNNCVEAVQAAKKYFYQTNGCYTCCRPCHTS